MTLCICGSGLEHDKCCGPILAGAPAPTAEALMRSRYTAYTVGNVDYIENTSAPEALDEFDRADVERFVQEVKWLGLKILRTVDGGPDDQTGQVEFAFECTHSGQEFSQHEISDFCRGKEGQWLYKNSIVNPKEPPAKVTQIGRNDPCPCASGKKYKKCCGA